MLNSLGISSPCCWSVFCTWLRRWSPSLPAFPALRITWSECVCVWGGVWRRRVFFYPLSCNGEKRQYSPPMFALLNGAHSRCWRCTGNGWQLEWEVRNVSHSQSIRKKLNYLFNPTVQQLLNVYRDRNIAHYSAEAPSPTGDETMSTRACKCLSCCYSLRQKTMYVWSVIIHQNQCLPFISPCHGNKRR